MTVVRPTLRGASEIGCTVFPKMFCKIALTIIVCCKITLEDDKREDKKMVTKARMYGFTMMICALCIAMAGMLFGSGTAMAEHSEAQALTECGVIHEPEFGGVYIKMTIDDFNSLGFVYGDSVTVSFSNGYALDDIPYYNGYYVQNGQPLLIAYPGYDYIKAAINNGDDLWTVAGLEDDATASITLKERGKYVDIQQARDIHYADDRSQFESDVVFANFGSLQNLVG